MTKSKLGLVFVWACLELSGLVQCKLQIQCYLASWSLNNGDTNAFRISDLLALNGCDVIVYAFFNIVENRMEPPDGNRFRGHFQQLSEIKLRNPFLKVYLSAGGWSFSKNFSALAADSGRRAAFATSTISDLRKWGLDGLDVDWEFPLESDKANFVALLKDLRYAFDADSRATSRSRLELSVAVSNTVLSGYDVPEMAKYLDNLNAMTYDYHGFLNGSQRETGYSAAIADVSSEAFLRNLSPEPEILSAFVTVYEAAQSDESVSWRRLDCPKNSLYCARDFLVHLTKDKCQRFCSSAICYSLACELERTLRKSVGDWATAGTPRSIMSVGIPFYARSWTLADPAKNGTIGISAVGPGSAGTISQEPGALLFTEFCPARNPGWVFGYSESDQVTYAKKYDQWIDLDDFRTIKAKVQLAAKENLRGVFVWHLGQDDVQGKCGQGRFPLLSAVVEEVCGPTTTQIPTAPVTQSSASISQSILPTTTTPVHIASSPSSTVARTSCPPKTASATGTLLPNFLAVIFLFSLLWA